MKENFYPEIGKNQEMFIPQTENTSNDLLVQTSRPFSPVFILLPWQVEMLCRHKSLALFCGPFPLCSPSIHSCFTRCIREDIQILSFCRPLIDLSPSTLCNPFFEVAHVVCFYKLLGSKFHKFSTCWVKTF